MKKYVNRLAIIGTNAIQQINYKFVKPKLFDLIFSKLLGLQIKYSTTNSVIWGFGKSFLLIYVQGEINWLENFNEITLKSVGKNGVKIQLSFPITQKLTLIC